MKILYLHQYFVTPEMQGGTRSYEMAKRMVAAGHEVHIVTSSKDEGRACHEIIDGINVHWLPVLYDNKMNNIRRVIAFLQFAFLCGLKAKRIGGDIVFATSTPLTIVIPALYAKWRLKIPMVFEVRDLWPELPIAMGAINSRFLQWLAYKMEHIAYNCSENVVGLSPGMCEGVAKTGYPPERIHNIPNSCDNEFFAVPESAGELFRKKHKWLDGRPLIVYAGTFGRINGVCYLAELAEATYNIDPEIRFLAVGAGAEELKLLKKAKELGVYEKNFYMLPPVNKNEIPELLSAATVCCSLFIAVEEMWNNSANKFFDALAASKPVVINYGGWQKDIIETNVNGLVLGVDNMTQAAHKLIDFINNEELVASASCSSKFLAESEFSRDSLAEKLIGVLEMSVKS